LAADGFLAGAFDFVFLAIAHRLAAESASSFVRAELASGL